MAGGINEVEHILLTIRRLVVHAGRLELDRDPPFPLQLHVVEELLLHIPIGHRAGVLQQPVGQRRLAMVDVGNDAEVANPFDGSVGHAVGEIPARASEGNAPILRSRHQFDERNAACPHPGFCDCLAIASEVMGTSFLKHSQGFSRPIPAIVMQAAYSTSMLLLSRVVQTISLGITYAPWSGIGIIAIVLVALLAYKQIPSPGQLTGIAMITAGGIIVNLTGKHP